MTNEDRDSTSTDPREILRSAADLARQIAGLYAAPVEPDVPERDLGCIRILRAQAVWEDLAATEREIDAEGVDQEAVDEARQFLRDLRDVRRFVDGADIIIATEANLFLRKVREFAGGRELSRAEREIQRRLSEDAESGKVPDPEISRFARALMVRTLMQVLHSDWLTGRPPAV